MEKFLREHGFPIFGGKIDVAKFQMVVSACLIFYILLRLDFLKYFNSDLNFYANLFEKIRF